MTTEERPAAPGRKADVDLYAVGADIPDGKAVLLVTEIDNSDRRFVGQWTSEEEVSKVWDGHVYIRLRTAVPAFPALVDADLILAHDGQLMPITRVRNASDWANDLHVPAAAVTTLHTDLESGEVLQAARRRRRPELTAPPTGRVPRHFPALGGGLLASAHARPFPATPHVNRRGRTITAPDGLPAVAAASWHARRRRGSRW